MAFAIGAANVPSFGTFLNSGLSPRLDHGAYPVLHSRNTSTPANDTVNLFIDATDPDYEYGASIITACADQTVYALQCTTGPPGASPTCGPNAAIATVTAAASTYIFSSAVTTRTLGYDVTVTAEESCALGGTTAATCTATVKGTADGTKTSTTTQITLSGSNYYRFDVAITGGAEKTANPTATCGAKGAAANLNPKNMVLWALAGVTGVTSILAML